MLKLIPRLALLLSCLLPTLSLAQIERAVQLSHSLKPAQGLKVGDEVTLAIAAKIDPGFHVYAAQQLPQMMMLAATFDLDEEASGIALAGPLTDEGHKETGYDDIFEADISLYHDAVTYLQKVRITGPEPRLVGYLRYQTCDDSRCIPGTYEVSIPITLTAAAPVVEPVPDPKPDPAPQPQPQERAQVPAPVPTPVVEPIQQAEPLTPPAGSRGIVDAVDWTYEVKPATVPRKGDILTLTFVGRIDPGFHVYSAVPPPKPAGLPTTFNLDETARDVVVRGTLQEAGEPIDTYDEIFETEVRYYGEEVTFTQEVEVTGDAPRIEGYLSYQICDDHGCVVENLDFLYEWEELPAEEVIAEEEASESLWVLILQAFAFGLGSVLTPCVFPLIPLTVSFFTKQSTSRAKGVRNGLTYGISIIAIYTVLGLLVSLIFGPDSMRQLSVSPGFNLALFALIFIFALSFLGMFEITLPSSWSTALSKGSDRGGLVGIFLMALTLAVVSFSCTGPLVFTALAEAANGEFIRPVLAMLSFSTAMALPFVIFSIFPGYLNTLPRSGGWLNSVKVVLGFLEMALAMIYLSRADLVMHWGLLDREIFIGAWMVIFLMLGMYLLGKLRLPHDDALEKISVPRLLMGMSALWFVAYLIPGLWGAPLPMLGGYIPESNKEMGVMVLGGQVSVASPGTPGTVVGQDICTYPNKVSSHLAEGTPQGFCAFYDLEQGLAYAREVGKPVFLDFTGHTCANCRYLEKNAWPDPEVSRYIREEYVLVSLYTDDRTPLPEVEITSDGKKLRTVGDKWIHYETTVYAQNAQPYYVLLGHDGQPLITPTGYNPPLDVQEYRDFFRQGLEAFRAQQAR